MNWRLACHEIGRFGGLIRISDAVRLMGYSDAKVQSIFACFVQKGIICMRWILARSHRSSPWPASLRNSGGQERHSDRSISARGGNGSWGTGARRKPRKAVCHTFSVENKPGAIGRICLEITSKNGRAGGYTLVDAARIPFRARSVRFFNNVAPARSAITCTPRHRLLHVCCPRASALDVVADPASREAETPRPSRPLESTIAAGIEAGNVLLRLRVESARSAAHRPVAWLPNRLGIDLISP